MDLFGISDSGKFIIRNYNLLANDKFKVIIDRDKSKGKEKAFKELAYIYCIADPKSKALLNGYNKKEKHNYGVSFSGLNEDYKPDDIINKAIEEYKKEYSTTVDESVQLMASMLRNMYDTLKILDVQMKKVITAYNSSRTDEIIDVDNILKINSKVIEMSTKLPKMIDDYDKAVEELNKSKMISGKMRGGGDILNSADPTKDY